MDGSGRQLDTLELSPILRDREQQVGERRRSCLLEVTEALVLLHRDHDHGRLASPGNPLGLTVQCGVDDGTERAT